MKKFIGFIPLLLLLASCQRLLIQDTPIVFDDTRKALSLEYLKNRYEMIQDEPIIKPQMVVVHWTAIPTFEKTFQAFDQSKLPGSRAKIQSASQLNVSAQYLVDRDGTIHQLLPDTVFARHVIGLNHCAIGIENVGNGSSLPLTKAQLKSNAALIKKLCEKHDIKYLIGHHEYQKFIGHHLWKETDPNYLTDKTDPGDDFMASLRKSLKKLSLQGPPMTDP